MQAKVKRLLGKEAERRQSDERTKASSHLCLLANEQAKGRGYIYAKQWQKVAYFAVCNKVLNDFVALNEYSKGKEDGKSKSGRN